MSRPYEIKQCEVDGFTYAYTERGEGKALLLLHGITTYSFIWDGLIAHLSKRFHVIAPDLLGCGNSSMPLTESFALRDHASHMIDFARAMKLTSFHLVGHDLGGGIAQIMAVRQPEMVQSLTLVNSVGFNFWPVQPIVAMRTPIIRQLAMSVLDYGVFRTIIQRGLYASERCTLELMDLFRYPLLNSEGKKAFLHFARCLDNQDLVGIAEKLSHLPMPTLIIRGAQDVYLGAHISSYLHSTIPHSTLLIIELAGHFIQIDEPIRLAGAIEHFCGGVRHHAL